MTKKDDKLHKWEYSDRTHGYQPMESSRASSRCSTRTSTYSELNLTLWGGPAPRCPRSVPKSRRRPSQPPNSPVASCLPLDRLTVLHTESSFTSSHPDLSLDLSSINDSDRETDSTSDMDSDPCPIYKLQVGRCSTQWSSSGSSSQPRGRSSGTPSPHPKPPRRVPALVDSDSSSSRYPSTSSCCSRYPSTSSCCSRTPDTHSGCSRRSADLICVYVDTVNNTELAKYFRPCVQCRKPCCVCEEMCNLNQSVTDKSLNQGVSNFLKDSKLQKPKNCQNVDEKTDTSAASYRSTTSGKIQQLNYNSCSNDNICFCYEDYEWSGKDANKEETILECLPRGGSCEESNVKGVARGRKDVEFLKNGENLEKESVQSSPNDKTRDTGSEINNKEWKIELPEHKTREEEHGGSIESCRSKLSDYTVHTDSVKESLNIKELTDELAIFHFREESKVSLESFSRRKSKQLSTSRKEEAGGSNTDSGRREENTTDTDRSVRRGDIDARNLDSCTKKAGADGRNLDSGTRRVGAEARNFDSGTRRARPDARNLDSGNRRAEADANNMDSGHSTLQLADSHRSQALSYETSVLSRRHVSLSIMQLSTAAQCARILADSLESVLDLAREELTTPDSQRPPIQTDVGKLLGALQTLNNTYPERFPESLDHVSFEGKDAALYPPSEVGTSTETSDFCRNIGQVTLKRNETYPERSSKSLSSRSLDHISFEGKDATLYPSSEIATSTETSDFCRNIGEVTLKRNETYPERSPKNLSSRSLGHESYEGKNAGLHPPSEVATSTDTHDFCRNIEYYPNEATLK